MRLLTPEIAWHETLPVYSCDLQHKTSTPINSDVPKVSERSPLTDITSSIPSVCRPDSSASRTISTPGWTRLATAGGDSVVRLWRVRLAWVSPTNSTSRASLNTIPESTATGKKKVVNNNAHMNLTEHLTYLASLKRHEKPVNAVRWSPSGAYIEVVGTVSAISAVVDCFVSVYNRYYYYYLFIVIIVFILALYDCTICTFSEFPWYKQISGPNDVSVWKNRCAVYWFLL
ncbi:Chromatin assembly factor 1 subunit B [Fasciolopsis buskii]|uniref:Chromatin assembly factor 1 subunit B n=1 Tax=Fasciolopsis buskii TaxID=27845 RepID=A0A8E0VG61_9TREM|nr:Chromatin assembly factor 1 subunit B [Fasciolopsis buski]